MPVPPSNFSWIPSAEDDLSSIRDHHHEHAQRCYNKATQWESWISLGARTPQIQLEYLTDSKEYNFYREWVGRSGYRLIFEISDDWMTVVAVLPKDDDTYDLDELRGRMDRETDR